MFRAEPKDEGVSLLKMDDGKVNAMGPAFLVEFGRAWRDATRDGRAVVLAGNAKAFSAGLDLKVLPTLGRDELLAFMRGFVRTMLDVYAHPRPVVAAVDGPALAGGAILALACDYRFATPAARIGLTEMPVGIPFPPPILDLSATSLPPQEIGPAIMRGAVREGDAAVAHGWAHRVAPRERVVEEAVAVAAEMAAFSPRAFAGTKRNLRAGVAARLAAFEKEGAEAYVDELLHPETIDAIVGYFQRVTAKR